VVVYTVLVLASDAGRVADAVGAVNPVWIPVFLLLPLGNYFIRFLKWQYFLRRIGLRVPFLRSLRVFVSGFAMTVSPGKLGELLKCYLLRDAEGAPVARTSPVVIAERITDLLSMVLVAVTGALLAGGYRYMAVAAAGLALCGVAMYVLLHPGAFRRLSDLLCRIPPLGRKRDRLDEFRESCTSLLDPASLLVTVPLGVVSWGLEALVLCAVAASIGRVLPAGTALLAHSAGSIAGAVSMIPGGLGLTEVTIDGILSGTLGVADATAVTLVMRFATLWFAVLLGVVTLALAGRRRCGPSSLPDDAAPGGAKPEHGEEPGHPAPPAQM
jgi:uncharacterized protein (TIRG00374 family)